MNSRSILISTLMAVIIISGCEVLGLENEKKEKDETVFFEVELIQGEGYEYDLGLFGDEEYAEILRDAEFAEVSEVRSPTPGTGKLQYNYQSISDYTGEDYVIIESRRGSNGESRNDKVVFTIITFKIDKE